jgi:hypothetical protein
MYRTTLKALKRNPELTPEIMYSVYNSGGRFVQTGYSRGIYGCTGQEFEAKCDALPALDGRKYYTLDIYAGLDHSRNARVMEYVRENGLPYPDTCVCCRMLHMGRGELCPACATKVFKCYVCGDSTLGVNLCEAEGKAVVVCSGCAYSCELCGDYPGIDGSHLHSVTLNGMAMLACKDCVQQIEACTHCGEVSDTVIYHEKRDAFLCPDCADAWAGEDYA